MSIVLDGLALPDSLQWTDRIAYQSTGHTYNQGLDGSLHVYTGKALAGRPITLAGTDVMGLIQYDVLTQLMTKRDTEGFSGSLNFHGDTYTVMFLSSGSSVEATPVLTRAGLPQAQDLYNNLVIRLIEV